jgi:hypothetical protein
MLSTHNVIRTESVRCFELLMSTALSRWTLQR